MKILVFIQSHESKINNNSIESLCATQKLASNNSAKVYAVTFDKTVAENLSQYDLSKVVLINNEELNTYNPLYYLKTIELLNNMLHPDLLIFGHADLIKPETISYLKDNYKSLKVSPDYTFKKSELRKLNKLPVGEKFNFKGNDIKMTSRIKKQLTLGLNLMK